MSTVETPIKPAGWENRPCLGTPITLWFGPDDEPTGQRVARHRQAKAICARCPFTDFCLDRALAEPLSRQAGVYGGLTAAERKRLLRSRLAAERQPV